MTSAQSPVLCCTGRPGPFPETTAPHSAPAGSCWRPSLFPPQENPSSGHQGKRLLLVGVPHLRLALAAGSRPPVRPAPWPMRRQCTGVRACPLCFPGRCLLPGSVDVLGQGHRNGGAHLPATQGLR